MRRDWGSEPPATNTVSIHASVKDATSVYRGGDFCNNVSIHASVKDATIRQRDGMVEIGFQSTHL